MLLREIRELTDAEVLTGQDMILFRPPYGDYNASDLMSDVLAQVKGHPLLITGLCNPQVMRTAEMMDISCVLFVRGKCPDEHVLELAREQGLCVMRTDRIMFEACGILYEAGLYGGEEDE